MRQVLGGDRLRATASRLLPLASSLSRCSLTDSLLSAPTRAFSSAAHCAGASRGVLSPIPSWSSGSRYYWHVAKNMLTATKYRFGLETPQKAGRKRLVFLGTGWAAMKFLPLIDTSKYEVTLVSPRNFFVFTPLLPSVCGGALSARSCMEPIRGFTMRGGKKAVDYFNGFAEDVDLENDSIAVAHTNGDRYSLPYDYLVVGVGSEGATFGIPGVAENSFPLKEAENAEAIRRRVLHNFELANLPTTHPTERKRLLHFVFVGGGPSGVETAAELADLVKEEMIDYFPDLVKHVKVTVIEMLPKVLAAFNDEVSEFTVKNFKKLNIDAMLRTRVTKVGEKSISVINPEGKSVELPCGFVMWASGIGQVPFSKRMMSKVPGQQNNRPAVINVDQSLRIKGVPNNNIFALGDCSFLNPRKLADHTDELFDAAKVTSYGAGTHFLRKRSELAYRFPQLAPSKNVVKEESNNMSKPEFAELLKKIDAGYKPPVPTAQNASQEGVWLATMMNDFDPKKDEQKLPSFVENFKGALAYVGDGESVALTPWFNIIGGFHSTIFWKTVYWSMQMSNQNKALLLTDWIRLRLAGRDVSCVRYGDESCCRPPSAPVPKEGGSSSTTSPA